MSTVLHREIVTPDRYPTRKQPTPSLIFRRDPAVYCAAGAGPIDEPTLYEYDENGFVTVEELLAVEEVAALRDEMDRLTADEAVRADERTVLDDNTGHIRYVYEAHRLSAPIAALIADERVVGRARQILGSDVYVHHSRISNKPGFGGGSFYWHSDFETWHAEDGMPGMRAVSVSIALADDMPHNGAQMMMPGSHRTFVSCVGEDPAEHYRRSLADRQVGTPDQESLRLLAYKHGIVSTARPAGSVTLFDGNCMHGSNGNITPFPRSEIFVVFNSVHNTPVDPFAAPDRRAPYLAARDFTPVR